MMKGTQKGGALGRWVKQQTPCMEGKKLQYEEREQHESQVDICGCQGAWVGRGDQCEQVKGGG